MSPTLTAGSENRYQEGVPVLQRLKKYNLREYLSVNFVLGNGLVIAARQLGNITKDLLQIYR